MDCKEVATAVETGSELACISSRKRFWLASHGTAILKRKVESTIVIRLFFILASWQQIFLRERIEQAPGDRRLAQS